jgi:hypothetical protein
LSETAEYFRTWIRSRSSRPFYISDHRFEKNQNGEIVIDRAVFDLEEAEHVGEMLLSANPFLKLSAIFAIWEKNGTLLKIILVSTILLLAIAIIIVSE